MVHAILIFETTIGSAANVLCDTLIISLYDGVMGPVGIAGSIDQVLCGQISAIIREQPDCTKYGKTTIVHTFSGLGCKRIILLGLGNQEKLTMDRLRNLSAIAMRLAMTLGSNTVGSIVHGHDSMKSSMSQIVQMLVEGTILGIYKFNQYKTQIDDDKPSIQKVVIIDTDKSNIDIIEQAIKKGVIIGEAVNLARDLVNHPANHMTPTKMAWHASEIAKQTNMEVTILDREQMQKQGMHALLAVARGTTEPPKLVVLKYMGNNNSKHVVAFVGKGITFDSGGISLKPSEGMHEMKDDMAGAAAVLGALSAIGRLKLNINVIGIIPCTENMPSGMALKPGDVISSLAGKTIEIFSTDAEGRLILADAVAYANKLGATHIIDLATLTGACVVALGSVTSGLITNDHSWARQVLDAAERTGEKIWELPNYEEYQEQIKSDIADLKNSGGRQAGAITAGLFIEQFVDKTPWVHIDIAGTVSATKNSGYKVKGATGVGVQTLIEIATSLENMN